MERATLKVGSFKIQNADDTVKGMFNFFLPLTRERPRAFNELCIHIVLAFCLRLPWTGNHSTSTQLAQCDYVHVQVKDV